MKQIIYLATVALDNEGTGQHFKVGAVVKPDDFPASVIKAWLKQGILKEQKDGNRKDK